MRDEIQFRKFGAIYGEDAKYKFYMCRTCNFYNEKDKICTKKRITNICAKKGLKNKE